MIELILIAFASMMAMLAVWIICDICGFLVNVLVSLMKGER